MSLSFHFFRSLLCHEELFATKNSAPCVLFKIMEMHFSQSPMEQLLQEMLRLEKYVMHNMFSQNTGSLALFVFSTHGLHFESNQEAKEDQDVVDFWNKFEQVLFKHRKLVKPKLIRARIMQECRESMLSRLTKLEPAVSELDGCQAFMKKLATSVGKRPCKAKDDGQKLDSKIEWVKLGWANVKTSIPDLGRALASSTKHTLSADQIRSLEACLEVLITAFEEDMITYARAVVACPPERVPTATQWD